jgi:hypothetical protein
MPRSQTPRVCRMPRANRRVAISVALIIGQILSASVGAGSLGKSVTKNPLSKKITAFEENAPYMSEMLLRISQKYGVRIGVDLGPKSPHSPIAVYVAQGNVEDLISATVAKTPGYKWTEVGGVVNIGPETDATTLLDIVIPHFQVKHATPADIHSLICSLPEVKLWLEQNHLEERTAFVSDILIGKNGVTNQPRVSLNVRNMTLRTIMNRMVKSPGFSSWMVGRWGDRDQYLTIGVN